MLVYQLLQRGLRYAPYCCYALYLDIGSLYRNIGIEATTAGSYQVRWNGSLINAWIVCDETVNPALYIFQVIRVVGPLVAAACTGCIVTHGRRARVEIFILGK